MRQRLLLAVLCPLAACQIERPLQDPAWDHARAGTVGVLGRFSVWNDHTAESRITFDSNFGQQEIELETELVGELGVGLGVEVYVADDWSLLLGYDVRRFQPRDTPGFLFQTVTSEEVFLATRWLTPLCFGSEDRWRTFLELKLGYVPSTRFDAEVDFSEIDLPNPSYVFDGDPYWNLGLSAGVLYQPTPNIVVQASLLYEWPLDATEDRVNLEIMPGYEVDMDTAIEPEGIIGLVGVTWYL